MKPPRKDKLVIAGNGLVGSLLSILLAKRGLEVEVFERRPDPRLGAREAGRSINLALSTRGLHALREAGLEAKALSQAIPMRGRMIHPAAGEPSLQPYGKDDSEHINSISRSGLNELLIDEAARLPSVSLRFNQKAVGCDFKKGTVKLQDLAKGALWEAPAEILIGADGAGSAVRAAMMALPGRDFSQSDLAHGYKELSIPSAPGDGDARFRLFKNALHIWPRVSHMLIALPNFDGSFTCTLFLPWEGPVSFESLRSPEDVERFFSGQFPDARALMPDLAEQFFANPTGAMAGVRCSPWNAGGRALLVGDAAHAMVPFYGQGMNCGFEDCVVLGEGIDRHLKVGGWDKVFSQFSAERKPDADAISEMAVENFVEMRDKVADPRFQLEKRVEKALQERFPGEYTPRYSLVTFSRVPYRVAQSAGEAQRAILGELCRGLKRPEDLDWKLAERLIRQKLSPILSKLEPVQ
ncbi:MAG: FAD-dependent monooxygenase [Elusimicrobia bacterium]|nr:FAD-dependent monooxygenase [Elusimicrobiota bacterium]